MSDAISVNYIQSALQTLKTSTDNLNKTQERTSSGLKIESASDNASYWSMSNAMKSDNKVLTSVGDALSLGASKTDTAYQAVDSAIDIVDQITSQLTTAKESSTDKSAINATIAGLKQNLLSVIKGASFSGDNWLYNTEDAAAGTKQVPNDFHRTVTGAVSLSYLTFDAGSNTLVDNADPSRGLLTGNIDADTLSSDSTGTARNYYLLDSGSGNTDSGTEIALDDNTTDDQLDDMISVVSKIASQLTSLGTTLGTMSNRIDAQSTFVSGLGSTLDGTVSSLVDADMEEESTKLAAYQTQQSLSTQILSMANSHLQSLATLFQ
ncbi:MAG: flagellin [Neorhizobium sp.]|jgi:flagellin|nr:flagellin [Neorhizobium sp.]